MLLVPAVPQQCWDLPAVLEQLRLSEGLLPVGLRLLAVLLLPVMLRSALVRVQQLQQELWQVLWQVH